MGKKIAIFAFVDAFGWEVFQRYGFLGDVAVHSRKLKTTFGFSSGADPSILTGRYPDEHTHWSCFVHDPKNSPFKAMKLFSFLPRAIFDRWRIRHWMSKLIAKWHRYTGYFEIYSVPFKVLPYFDYTEKYNYFIPGGIMKTDTIFDWCVAKDIPYYCSDWHMGEEEILKCNKEQIRDGEIELTYLYLPKLDAVMHSYGNKHPEVEKKIRWLETQVKDVIDVAKENYEDVSFYVFSDHGMTNVDSSLDLIPMIEKTGLKFGSDYVAMYDSTMARFWFMNDRARDIVAQVLSGVEKGHIVSDDELKDMHVYFEDGHYGEMFFLVEPGVLLCPSYMGLSMIPGMHGYHPDDKDSYAFIGSNRELSDDINSITDIRKLMETELLSHERELALASSEKLSI